MKIIDDLSSKVLEIVTSKDFNPKTKGTVRFIINQCRSEVRSCLDAGLPLKELVRILNDKSHGHYVFRYDSFFKAWKKIDQSSSLKSSTVLKSEVKPINAQPDATNVSSGMFKITSEDDLGNFFTNDPEAPFGRDRYCFPYHKIQANELDSLINKGFSRNDSTLLLKYNIDSFDLFGSNLPLKANIHPAIQNRIESIRKDFSIKNVRIIKSRYKDIIK